jgi:hypothetical protein
MSFWRSAFVLGVLCACDSTTTTVDGDGPSEPEPLPADLIAACPEAERFERSASGPCTQIGCVNGYMLNVSPSSGWASGAYRFEITSDRTAVTCQGSLPLKACSEQSFSCDADGVRLGESGCALAAGQQGISTIMFEGYPLALSVRVLRDGEELANVELDPVYSAGQPNGPGCDPICCGATGELTVAR